MLFHFHIAAEGASISDILSILLLEIVSMLLHHIVPYLHVYFNWIFDNYKGWGFICMSELLLSLEKNKDWKDISC